MSETKSNMVEHASADDLITKEEYAVTVATKDSHNPPDENVSPQLFKLAKKFMIDGGLMPKEQQNFIEERTLKRAKVEQLRKQNNIENIMQKTQVYCADFELSQRTDLDWFSRYISLAEDVSNSTMQDLWAKILSGELTKPGTFSYKAIKVFKDMSIYDAKLFAKACSLAIKDNGHKNIRLVTGVYQKPRLFNFFSKQRQQYCNLSHYGLKYSDLLALSESHLIYLQENESSLIAAKEHLQFNYNGTPLKLTAKKSDVCIQFYKFTPLGAELATLITDKANENFFEHLKSTLLHFFSIEGDKVD